MVSVLLDGISNILSAATRHGESETVAQMIEECGGLDKLEELQAHENEQLYKKALEIIETFFPDEEGVSVEDDGQAAAFEFNHQDQAQGSGGFNF